MVKVCARPGCGQRATARFAFDAPGRLVVLDALVDQWGGSGVLCTEHADALRPMRGWTLEDRRDGPPRLFPVTREPQRERSHRRRPEESASRPRRTPDPEQHPSTPLPLDGAAPESATGHADQPIQDAPEVTALFAVPTLAAEPSPAPVTPSSPAGTDATVQPGSGSLLGRAFDAAHSRVRPDSTMGSLIPRTALG